MSDIYDIIIIGGGPAGLSAALYSARAKMSTILFEKGQLGGQIMTSGDLANYPGFYSENHEDLHPKNLISQMEKQVRTFGANIELKEITHVNIKNEIKEVTTFDGVVYKSKAIILATGAVPRRLGCKGEIEYTGKGISYCATCDADFFTDLEVFCIGGGDTAVEEAIYLSKFARKVTLIVRKDYLRCANSIEEKAKSNPKIEIKFRTELLEVKGDGVVESAVFLNNETGETYEYKASEDDGVFGVFIFVGYDPLTTLFKDDIKIEEGFAVGDEDMNTELSGVFVAGDLRKKSFKQVVTAVSDGAISAMTAEKYIEHHFTK